MCALSVRANGKETDKLRKMMWSQVSTKVLKTNSGNSVLNINDWDKRNVNIPMKTILWNILTQAFRKKKLNVNQIHSSKLWCIG